MSIVAFTVPLALPARHGAQVCASRSHSRSFCTPRLALQPPDPPDKSETPPLFVEEKESFWTSYDVNTAFAPITEAEKAQLREKLPDRVAQFLIRRAEAAAAQRDAQTTESTFVGKLLKDLPPDVADWEAMEQAEFRDYVYEASAGAPAFRRRGSSLFGGGDGLPDKEEKVMSLFVGNVGSVDEQASRVGYSLIMLVVGFVLLKLLLALISFFVSFTFSFLAIFALSAGIFVVFFLLRF